VEFIKYQHIERLGATEVEGITQGVCYVFPKIDGTNGSVWLKGGQLAFGSRNHELGGDGDNQGFRAACADDPRILAYLSAHPTHRLYGEWLVPHSLKTYRTDAWRKFYVFDVSVDVDQGDVEGPVGAGDLVEYLPYTIYQPLLVEHGLDYIPLLAEVRAGTDEQFYNLLDQNKFLVQDGAGAGEGIVIKNYSYKNRYGRTTWAKIVRSEFKTLHSVSMGAPVIRGATMVEESIVAKFCTDALIDKELAKIVADAGRWESKMIPRLLNTVFYCLVTECAWEIVKDFKSPTVNYKTLARMVNERVKEAKREIFA
jgi:hypothetical protein